MRKFGCLLIGLICFVSIVGVYAFNIIEKDDVHTPDYYESNVRSMFGREQWEAGKPLLARTLAEEDRTLSETGQCRRSRPPAQEAEANLS